MWVEASTDCRGPNIRETYVSQSDTVTRECHLSAKAVLGAGAGPAHAGSALFTEDRLRRKVQNLSAQVL